MGRNLWRAAVCLVVVAGWLGCAQGPPINAGGVGTASRGPAHRASRPPDSPPDGGPVGAPARPSSAAPAPAPAPPPPPAPLPPEIARLVDDLADDTFPVRDGATEKLKSLGRPYYASLARARDRSDDPEVRLRLGMVLTELRLWDGRESIADFMRRVGLGQTKHRVDLGNQVAMTLALIPPGKFLMGSPATEPGRCQDETQHQVTLRRPFMMGTTEVTGEQWRAVMGNDRRDRRGRRRESVGDQYPVCNVSWDEAMAFCTALGTLDKDHRRYRLPTEAEWEFACRAGTTGEYSTGDGATALDQAGWYLGNSSSSLPVGQKQANAWGLYDMHGNLWEWCSDFYGPYPAGPVTDPQGDAAAGVHVLRGGTFLGGANLCRSAQRAQSSLHSDSSWGFRVVMELPE